MNEDEAKEIALGIISESYLNACGGNFNKHLIINKENPLDVSGVWGIDKSGYTFESNNGECTIIIYVYKYWGGYESALDPD